ncbi:hypothetical protein DFJ73DRAFT_782753 [Zopfochytrium polystomum]|nr:hypothetical protein DFJ73DRAFT_782753 [Zopfochytrium polystomum]
MSSMRSAPVSVPFKDVISFRYHSFASSLLGSRSDNPIVHQPVNVNACRRARSGLRLSTSQRHNATAANTAKSDDGAKVSVLGRDYPRDALTNVSSSILSKTPLGIHRIPHHPLNILKSRIESHFAARSPGVYAVMDSLHPVVTPKQNFDDLLVAKDHPSRLPNDTYYVNANAVLRTHTSAHQSEVLASRKADGYLLSADVYRRDEIDPTHYPVFHQMEGIRTFPRDSAALRRGAALPSSAGAGPFADAGFRAASDGNPVQPAHDPRDSALVAYHLKDSFEHLVLDLLSHVPRDQLKVRWVDAYFPFTSPSWELEVLYNGKWLELCGCGVMRQEILDDTGNSDRIGWAFGLGLERIAMVLFNIPDIRLFWTQDERFLSQFRSGALATQFQPYSKYPACYKDVSFWLPDPSVRPFHDNDMFEVVRDVAGDLVEDVTLIDTFANKKTNRVSKCFRINYRSMDRCVKCARRSRLFLNLLLLLLSRFHGHALAPCCHDTCTRISSSACRTLTNAEIDTLQDRVREQLAADCGVELRG